MKTTSEATKKRILEGFVKVPNSRLDFQRMIDPILNQAVQNRAAAKHLFEGVALGLKGDDLFRWMGCQDGPNGEGV